MVAVFSLDISVFLSIPCKFEVYLRCWSFLEACLDQDEAYFIDICQIRGGWPSRTNTLGYLYALLSITEPFPCFLLLGRIIIKEWGSSLTQRLKFSPPTKRNEILWFKSFDSKFIVNGDTHMIHFYNRK